MTKAWALEAGGVGTEAKLCRQGLTNLAEETSLSLLGHQDIPRDSYTTGE